MKLLFYAILVACALQGCSSDPNLATGEGDADESDYYELKTIPDRKVVFKACPMDGKQKLGAGYDATADYLSPEAIKAPVIDLDKMTDNEDDYIIRIQANADESKDYAGKDALAFLTDITERMNLKGIGSNSIISAGTLLKQEEFLSAYGHSSQYSFACSERLFTAERWYFTPFYLSERYKYKYLTQEFKSDVASRTAEEIIKKYGTHLLMDIGIGARFRGLYRTAVPVTTSSSVDKVTILSALDAIAQQGLFTGSGAGGWEEELAQSIGGQLIMEFFGGDTSLLSSNPTGNDFKAWWNSFKEENYTLTAITHGQALPIYEMIEDAAKKEQVKSAVQEYIARQKVSIISSTPLLQAWDGKNHTYYTPHSEPAVDSNRKYEGAVCSIYGQPQKNTVPLYLYSNGQKQRLSTKSLQDAGWELEKEMGYVYASSVEGAIPLYEAESKNDYCYTTEDKPTYGNRGSWKKTGIAGYVMPL